MTTLLVVGFATATLVRHETTFNVTAETERLQMILTESPSSRWPFDDVAISEDDEEKETGFSGFLELAPQTRVLIERVALGPMLIHIECSPGCTKAGRL